MFLIKLDIATTGSVNLKLFGRKKTNKSGFVGAPAASPVFSELSAEKGPSLID